MMIETLPKRLQATILRIRGDHPFFGTLALFAELSVTIDVPTAATDGKTIYFNPNFIEKLDAPRLCGLFVHELLHAALQHNIRRREREPVAWNIAADIVVNGMIRKDTEYLLPEGAVENVKLSHLSVEEIYEQITRSDQALPYLGLVDVMSPIFGSGRNNESESDDPHATTHQATGSINLSDLERIQRHWRGALQQAVAVARRVGKGIGKNGLGATRDVQGAQEAKLSWRELLWQFIVSTPFDFSGFDRRFIHKGLYLEEMQGDSVEIAICVDTSGSIGGTELDAFYSEIYGIIDAYPHIRGHLFYADADLYGPYEFSRTEALPEARGGGGTDFQPFFRWLEKQSDNHSVSVCIYFTDGYGTFPSAPSRIPTLWVVSRGGLESTVFPFGMVARMAVES